MKEEKNIYFSQLKYSHTCFRKLSLDVDRPRFIYKHTNEEKSVLAKIGQFQES